MDLLIKSRRKDRIELRLFEIVMVLTVSLFVFWSFFVFLIDYPLEIRVICLCVLASFSILYLGFRLGWNLERLTISYYATALFYIMLAWLPYGGVTGSILHLLVLVFASGLLILNRRGYAVLMIATISIVTGYFFIELNFPDAAFTYTRSAKIVDMSVSSLLMFSLLGYGLYQFKLSNEIDRKKLKKAINELEEAKLAAEAADQSKTKFLATISHEMRTPLNGIIGLSELLEKTSLNEEQQEILNGLSYSSDLLHSLISDVLDLSLIEDDKLILQENEISIEKEIGSILEIFKRRLDSRSGNVTLTYTHDSEIPVYLYQDSTRFKQVLINIINNAIKFTREGDVKVASRIEKSSIKEVVLSFSVSDTGEGINEEKKEHIFKKFYKASDDQTIEGSGLGLSICKNLVERMGGTIDFESEEGVGSTFRFELPFKRKIGRRQIKDLLENEKSTYQNLNVLVAEDIKINQMVISKMLRNLGVTSFDVVDNGEEAVAISNEKNYDFILMDVQMPKKNGIEATRDILSRKNRKAPSIVAVTANVISGEKEECKRAGMTDFISKPITSEMLKEVFDKYL